MRIGLMKRMAAVATAMVGLLALGGTARASEMVEPGVMGSANAAMGLIGGQRYQLHLHHLHTGESLDVTYRIGNTYMPDAMSRLNHFLRDHRTQDEANYDPREFDVLHSVLAKLGRANSVIDIVCGYRTPESNHYLRTRSADTGVAEHSQHMQSKAIDIRVPGVQTLALRDAALSLGAGGVGYYPVSQFVHVDVGPVREWQFGGVSRRGHLHQARHAGAGSRHHARRHRA